MPASPVSLCVFQVNDGRLTGTGPGRLPVRLPNAVAVVGTTAPFHVTDVTPAPKTSTGPADLVSPVNASFDPDPVAVRRRYPPRMSTGPDPVS